MTSNPAPPLTVALGDRSYAIVFGDGLQRSVAAQVRALARAGRRAVVVTDTRVARRQRAALQAMFGGAPRRAVPAGETSKSLAVFGRLLDFFAAEKLDRGGVVFAVGGGVVGDLAGFAAASYLRGIDYFQVPTTLLAMVDSSVGGKTGINLRAGKNLAGAFHQPRGVFVDTRLLRTLPRREFAAGMAEVIKTGLLGDAALFGELERQAVAPGDSRLAAVVRCCCEIKAAIVAADERELAPEGGRALLNLGHTFAHAIERVAGYGTYLHGEAVAIGLGAAADLSRRLGLIVERDAQRVRAVLAAHGLPVRLRRPLSAARLMAATAADKKARGGERRFVVLRGPGQAETRSGVPAALAEACFRAAGAK
ncbi:MAG TPA: 3-dehydroquinate synthase [Opitutaceae bacterium]|jgi:3-dehydroquinate synthase|nr:3-dehydroquinate synthase [Opitutaceae bacterium]